MGQLNHLVGIIFDVVYISVIFLLPSIFIGALFRRLALRLNSILLLALSISLLVTPLLMGWFYLCRMQLNNLVIEGLATWDVALFFSFTSYFIAAALRFIWVKLRKNKSHHLWVEDLKNIAFFIISIPILSYLAGVAYLLLKITLSQNNPIQF